MALGKSYKMQVGDYELFKRASDPRDGIGINWFISYYFGGRELREWQWYFGHAPQRQKTVIGGTGSGKTVGAGLVYATFAAMTPRYSYMNLAPTAWQSQLQYKAILQEADGKPYEKFIHKYSERPYPRIVLKSDYIGESTLMFMSAADDAERVQGVELDAANLDEAGVIVDGTWLLTMMVTRLRGTVPLPWGGFRKRTKQLSVITANYDFAPPWLWDRMDKMFRNPKNFLSMIVKSQDNLSEEDIEDYKLVIPEDRWGVILEGDKPEGKGEHFSIEAISACEDWTMNRAAQYHLLEKEKPTPDWAYEERPSVGCVHFEMPSEAKLGRQYLLVGDPGQGNPPNRNAYCIGVWDVTAFPDDAVSLVYFKWGYGNQSYGPFLADYEYCWNKYRPIDAVVDSTGTQKLWDEQVLIDRGIWATGMDFSGQKKGMLVATMRQMQRRLFRFPYVQGIRSQLLNYILADDLKLSQDIVAVFLMTSMYLRTTLWENYEDEKAPLTPPEYSSARDERTPVITARAESEIVLPHGYYNTIFENYSPDEIRELYLANGIRLPMED